VSIIFFEPDKLDIKAVYAGKWRNTECRTGRRTK